MATRVYSVDSMRIIAMLFVVVIHTNPFAGVGGYGNGLNFLLETVGRFAVPFFFITAGYFFAMKTADGPVWPYLRRRFSSIGSLYLLGIVLALPVFVSGTVTSAYAAGESVPRAVAAHLMRTVSPIELFYYGTSVSEILWFLPALFVSLAAISVFVVTETERYLLPVSVGLHLVGLLAASYTMVIDLSFQFRDGLFFGFFYTTMGYYVYTSEWQPTRDRSTLYLAVTIVFGLLHVVERFILGYWLPGQTFSAGVYSPTYTLFTAVSTLALFIFLLSRPSLGESTPLPSWGAYAVGIYVVHPPVLFVFEQVGDAILAVSTHSVVVILWHLLFTPATFFGALAVYLILHRLHVIEIGGSHLPSWPHIQSKQPQR